MDGLLSLLLVIGAFFLMMRFGCGSHMLRSHGGQSGGCCGGDKARKVSHTDPVCGTEVSDEQGYSKFHDSRVYKFCSRECFDEFEASPEKFLVTSETKKEGLAA